MPFLIIQGVFVSAIILSAIYYFLKRKKKLDHTDEEEKLGW